MSREVVHTTRPALPFAILLLFFFLIDCYALYMVSKFMAGVLGRWFAEEQTRFSCHVLTHPKSILLESTPSCAP